MIALYITEAAFNVDRYEMQSSLLSHFTFGFESDLTTLEAAAPALTLAVQLKGPPLPPQKKSNTPHHRCWAICSQ